MKGPKWLQKLNEEELKDFPLLPKWQAPHYLAGPGKGRILQEELYEYAGGTSLEFMTSNLPEFQGAKFWPKVITYKPEEKGS